MTVDEEVGHRIRLARKAAGLPLRALSQSLGISFVALQKYETGRTMPGSDMILRLAHALDVPIDFFFRQTRSLSIEPLYRTRGRLSGNALRQVEAHVHEWLERYLEAEEVLAGFGQNRFSWPTGLDRRVNSVEDAERLATNLREAWGLNSEPVYNLLALLEGRGIRVGVVPQVPDFNALSFMLDNAEPVIVLADGYPGDRRRFSAAHELGHLALLPIENDDLKDLANRFAGAFLAPTSAVYRELGHRRQAISVGELEVLKHKYGLSMQGWLHRAIDLGILSKAAYQRARREFQDRDWESHEPGEPFPVEEPLRLRQLILHALAEEVISVHRAADLLREPPDRLALTLP